MFTNISGVGGLNLKKRTHIVPFYSSTPVAGVNEVDNIVDLARAC